MNSIQKANIFSTKQIQCTKTIEFENLFFHDFFSEFGKNLWKIKNFFCVKKSDLFLYFLSQNFSPSSHFKLYINNNRMSLLLLLLYITSGMETWTHQNYRSSSLLLRNLSMGHFSRTRVRTELWRRVPPHLRAHGWRGSAKGWNLWLLQHR